MRVRDKPPNVVLIVENLETGEIRTIETDNEWTSAGLDAVRDWWHGDTVAGMTHIAWVDTGGTEQVREVITQRIKGTTGKLTIKQYLSSLTGNGHTYDTVQVYNAASGGTCFAAATFTAIEKTAAIQITATWDHTAADDGA